MESMESIYFVTTWLCHRTCVHCYEDRFHPYYGGDLDVVVNQSRTNVPRIIEHLPPRLTFRDRREPGHPERPGQIILAGGEVLLEPVRESVLYPAIAHLHRKYDTEGGVRILIQTTGDLVTPRILADLKDLRVTLVSISGLDAFHNGLEQIGARDALKQKLTAMFQAAGYAEDEYHFFGATPDSWIGALCPRGRAFQNSLSTATLADNFCNRWSGGLGFLDTAYEGSEVSIDPAGDVFPCCLKTKKPLGNLLVEPLDRILARCQGNPVYEAISRGQPERMGLTHGWSIETFLEKSKTTQADGRPYQNLCLGCDRFHSEMMP